MDVQRAAVLLVSFALLTFSCKTPEEGMIGEPPEDEEQTQIREGGPRRIELPAADDSREPSKEYPAPIFAVDGWPYNDEANTFSLEWAGAPAVLPVHEAPSRNAAIVGEYSVQRGQEIPWRNTRINVFKPTVFETKQAMTIEGFRWAPESRALHRQPLDARVGPGTPVAVYHYQGRQTCIMGVGDKLVEALCPTPEAFAGSFRGRTMAEKMQPADKIWWVQITTRQATGWIMLDDRVAVDIEQL
jgi:hypothetical protein